MHQTFYIDIDEEITSIVDRLRRAKSKEVVIVVPKRAILIQSIVNLKLLKKEADSLKKELIIVTQDKLGKMLVEKAGIAVEQKLDDVIGEEVIEPENLDDRGSVKIDMDMQETENKKRFDRIGSDGYYQQENFNSIFEREAYIENKDPSRKENGSGERIINKELVVDVSDDLKKHRSTSAAKKGFARMDMVRNLEISDDNFLEEDRPTPPVKKAAKRNQGPGAGSDDSQLAEDRKVKNFFDQNRKKKEDSEYKNINIGKHARKYFFAFSLLASIAIMGTVAYLFLPKATVTISPKSDIQSADTQIQGDVNAGSMDLGKGAIPAKIVTVEQDLSATFPTTGKKSASNQKAKGTIALYNEFSPDSQPLVATTRVQSSDGKIFRLVSGVTVPGYVQDAGGLKPGVIQADVVADEAGSAYNIGPGSFTIPGFQVSNPEKYSKIYGKSSDPMTGGGDGTGTADYVTDSDISSAKTKIMSQLVPQIRQKLKDAAGADYIVLDDAINTDDSTYTLSNSSGDMADNLTVSVKTDGKAIVFKKDDVNAVLVDMLSKKGDGKTDVNSASMDVQFGKSDVNFANGTITIRAHASADLLPNIDLDTIKSNIIGKTEAELQAYLSTYPGIDHIGVSYWPSFLPGGKMPAYASRIDVVLDKN